MFTNATTWKPFMNQMKAIIILIHLFIVKPTGSHWKRVKKKNSRKTPGIQNTRDVLHKKNSCELTGYLLKCFKYKGKKLDLFLKIFCLCLYRSVKLEMIFFLI